jgi:hypothetical protein
MTSAILHTFLFEITNATRASSNSSANDLQQKQELYKVKEQKKL